MGTRLRQYHMLCGALLRVWKRVSDVVADITNSSILQIVRLKTKDSNKQVGELSCRLFLRILQPRIILMFWADNQKVVGSDPTRTSFKGSLHLVIIVLFIA